MTVKKRLLERYSAKELQDSSRTKTISFAIVAAWFLSLILTGYYQSYVLALICGYLIFPVVGVAHNFVHMKNNPFKYLYLVTGFSPK